MINGIYKRLYGFEIKQGEEHGGGIEVPSTHFILVEENNKTLSPSKTKLYSELETRGKPLEISKKEAECFEEK